MPPDEAPDPVLRELRWYAENLTTAPGHRHLYERFDALVQGLHRDRLAGRALDDALASGVLALVRALVAENGVGRRPWSGGWEVYYARCMDCAQNLLSELCAFEQYASFIPFGYAQGFADTFAHMDRHHEHYAERDSDHWADHFLRLARCAAGMLSRTADARTHISESWLEHPDDAVFTHLLTALARTGKARKLLQSYLRDDEAWVRDLARNLLATHHDSR